MVRERERFGKLGVERHPGGARRTPGAILRMPMDDRDLPAPFALARRLVQDAGCTRLTEAGFLVSDALFVDLL